MTNSKSDFTGCLTRPVDRRIVRHHIVRPVPLDPRVPADVAVGTLPVFGGFAEARDPLAGYEGNQAFSHVAAVAEDEPGPHTPYESNQPPAHIKQAQAAMNSIANRDNNRT